MTRVVYPESLEPANVVHHTEQGRMFLQRMLAGLRQRDPIPPLATDSLDLISALRAQLEQTTNLDAAVTAIKQSPYFEPYLREHTVLIAQVRNHLPSDTSIVYRHADGEFDLESMYLVSHDDPTGPLVTGPWLAPATAIRSSEVLQRQVFGLHEFAEPEELLDSRVYRTIYADRLVSWHATILARDAKLTWVLYVWFRADDYTRLRQVVTRIRVGLARVAPRLGEIFEAELHKDPHVFRDEDSVHQGMLQFDEHFTTLRRTNFAAEMMLQSLTDPYQVAPRRVSVYERIRLEYQRRTAAGLPCSWTVDSYCHPTDFYPANGGCVPALRVSVEHRVHENSRTKEVLVRLRELHLPHLRPLASWRLIEHPPAGVATSLKRLGSTYREGAEPSELPDGYFIKAIMCVARPVWDIDIIADRVQHYYRIEATELGRKGLKNVDFKQHPMCALLFRGQIIGVLQAI